MLNILKTNAKPTPTPGAVSLQMRDVLFGDLPWAQWCRADIPNVEPWSSFKRVRAMLEAGNVFAAITLQGPLNVFANDPMAGPVIQRGSLLMEKLISKTQKGP